MLFGGLERVEALLAEEGSRDSHPQLCICLPLLSEIFRDFLSGQRGNLLLGVSVYFRCVTWLLRQIVVLPVDKSWLVVDIEIEVADDLPQRKSWNPVNEELLGTL